uniref:Odorant receptor n=1 Tax=Adelphocoris lineolatus TaxID=236346 RepID=A0A2I4PH34_ADELI|nr:olfactory receptor 41 [Adelphocoris lineolatus]
MTQSELGMFNGLKLNSSVRIEKWISFGYRLLLLGMTPEKFLDKSPAGRVRVYLTLFMIQSFYCCHEIAAVVYFSRSLLERITHGYIMTYVVAFNMEWYFLLYCVRSFHENELHLERFESTQAHFEFSERAFDRNTKVFLTCLAICVAWWGTNNSIYIFGPLLETVMSFIRSGEFKQVSILPQVFSMPWWLQIIVYIHNALLIFSALVYCVSSFIILGSKILKVKTQCDILSEALKNDTGEESNVRAYVKDHIQIIKAAKLLNEQLATLNAIIFTACYLQIAIQMFTLTLFEPSGAYFFAIAFDSLSIFLILSIQCWFASIITLALESVSDAVYETDWYRRDKTDTLDVLLMLQMAQQEVSQKIWFKSLKVERAASLNMIRSSYAMYTALMIFQD